MSDLDELVTTERFGEIHEARQQVIQDERSLNEALATGRIDDNRARRLFQRSVDTFVRELECLLNPPDDDPSEYWTSVGIGTIPLPGDRVYEVEGLGDYLDLNEEQVVEVETVVEGRYYEVGELKTEERAVQPPWDLLRAAFRVANAALTDLGMELSPASDDDDRWSFREIKDVEDINPEEWGDISVVEEAMAAQNGGEV